MYFFAVILLRFGIDCILQQLFCCGVRQPYDWKDQNINGTITEMEGFTFTVPESCCKYPDCKDNEIYNRGCLDRLSSIVSESALMLGIGATCVAFVQVKLLSKYRLFIA